MPPKCLLDIYRNVSAMYHLPDTATVYRMITETEAIIAEIPGFIDDTTDTSITSNKSLKEAFSGRFKLFSVAEKLVKNETINAIKITINSLLMDMFFIASLQHFNLCL